MAAAIRLSQQHSCSFDHLVGAREQRCWHIETKRLRSLQVDDELEFGRLNDRQVRRLGSLEDATGVNRRLPSLLPDVGSIAHQPACHRELTKSIARRDGISCRQRDNAIARGAEKERIALNEEHAAWSLGNVPKDHLQLAFAAGADNVILLPERACGLLHVSGRLVGWIVRIDKKGERGGFGSKFTQELHSLGV